MKSMCMAAILLAAMAALAGCQQESSNPQADAVSVDGAKFLLAAEPGGAAEVIEAKQAENGGEEVVIVGRIGGSMDPWIENMAAFSIVDRSVKACSDIPGDQCATPWDYCCETHKLPASTALVKVVDETGQPVKVDARKLLNVTELSTVVVKGKAQRDEAGNLTILASGVHVKN